MIVVRDNLAGCREKYRCVWFFYYLQKEFLTSLKYLLQRWLASNYFNLRLRSHLHVFIIVFSCRKQTTYKGHMQLEFPPYSWQVWPQPKAVIYETNLMFTRSRFCLQDYFLKFICNLNTVLLSSACYIFVIKTFLIQLFHIYCFRIIDVCAI